MEFELHIWGPAFGLPSIDAECIAATVFINRLLDPKQWSLVAAHDPSQSPTGDFPALYHDSQWVGGFSAIVQHLANLGYSLDTDLAARRRADVKAITVHLATNALPLLDATFYTSSANYFSSTKPAWKRILPGHANLTIPARKLAAAKSRTTPLGLSTGSVDDLPGQDLTSQQQQEARVLSSSPSLLFKKKQTLKDALSVQQSRNLFRLESLTEDAMEPVADFLGEKPYLLSADENSPCSVDCLALGYLSLLLNFDLENNWVGESIRNKYKRVAAYTERMKMELLPRSATTPEAVMQNASTTTKVEASGEALPWALATSAPLTTIFQALARSMLSSLVSPVQQHLLFCSGLVRNSGPTALRSWTSPVTLALALSGPAITAFTYLLYLRIHSSREPNKRFSSRQFSRLTEFGNAGQLLSALGDR